MFKLDDASATGQAAKNTFLGWADSLDSLHYPGAPTMRRSLVVVAQVLCLGFNLVSLMLHTYVVASRSG